MKKLTLILLAIIVLLSARSIAQSTYLSPMINMASTNIHYGKDNASMEDYKKSENGIQAGLSFQGGISKRFSIVSEVYFMKKGGKLKSGSSISSAESRLRLNTLELPVLGRFHLGRFYMNVGPSVAYNLSGKSKVEGHSTKLSFDVAQGGFRRFEAGMQMGGGIEIPLSRRKIAVDIRYSHGLTNVARTREIRNRALMISVHSSTPWKTNPLRRF